MILGYQTLWLLPVARSLKPLHRHYKIRLIIFCHSISHSWSFFSVSLFFFFSSGFHLFDRSSFSYELICALLLCSIVGFITHISIVQVAALLLLSQQEERQLLERNVNAALQKKVEELQRNILQVIFEMLFGFTYILCVAQYAA